MTRFSSFILCNVIMIAIFYHVVISQELSDQIEIYITSENPLSSENLSLNDTTISSAILDSPCITSCMKSEFTNNDIASCYDLCSNSTLSENDCLDSCSINDISCIDLCKMTFQCPIQCHCREVEDLVDIECIDYSARLQRGEIFGVNCKNSTEILPSFIYTINESIPYIRFTDCPLPETSFNDIISLEGNIKTLSLRNIQGELTKNHFTDLYNLTRLDLAFNQLKYLPEDLLQYLTSLICLDLNDNMIKNISYDFLKYSPNLGELYLDNNKLYKIPDLIFINSTKLWHLSLWSNNIMYIDSTSFTGLGNLINLDLSHNKLQFLPYDTFKELKSLRTLDLSYNSFSFLPLSLFIDLSKLNIIKINGNYKSINSTSDVEWIQGKNKELELPNYLFSNLKRLRKLSISESGLLQVPRFIVRETESILELDFHGNLLSTLPRFMLQDAINLVSLDISDNILTELPYDLFSQLVSLRELRVNGNNLLKKLPRSFVMYARLEVLQLHNCNFTALPEVVVRQLRRATNLRILTLSGNPWRCDCEARDFVSLAQSKALDLESTTCEDGRSFTQLNDSDLCQIIEVDKVFNEEEDLNLITTN